MIGPLDSSVNIAFPRITQDFGIPIDAIQWVVVCYVLTHSSLMLAFGKLGDLMGHKRVFRLGLILCAIAFILCATASSFSWLLFARVGQGLGMALVIGCAPALVTALYPEHQRARALGVYTMIFGLGAVIGPSLGGFLVQEWGWRSVFWFRAPLALAAFGLLFVLPTPPRAPSPARFDLAGAGLFAIGLAALLLAINASQRVNSGWLLPTAIAGASLLAFIGFFIREAHYSDPIIRPGLFRDIDFTILNLTNLILNLVGFSVMLLVPYYLVRILHLPTTTGGVILAIAPLGVVLAGPLGARLIERFPANRLALIGGVTVGLAMLSFTAWRDPLAIGFAATILFAHGFGLGLYQVAYMHIVTGTMARTDRGVAGSLAMVTRSTGVVMGATILSSIFAHASLSGAAGGADDQVGFINGFVLTFQYGGGGLLIYLCATMLRPRIWFQRNAT
ncbi:MAG: EmrB/QacA subfamily drug resistance transporter [Alphaproteobacteria bacterium]|jgi:EmrB/QacA subfamily drug resistance transporter